MFWGRTYVIHCLLHQITAVQKKSMVIIYHSFLAKMSWVKQYLTTADHSIMLVQMHMQCCPTKLQCSLSYCSKTHLTSFLNNSTNKKDATFKSFENPKQAYCYLPAALTVTNVKIYGTCSPVLQSLSLVMLTSVR